MKKLFSFIILLLCCALLCSCELDISSQLNAISSQLYDIATGAGGSFLKETTSTEPPSSEEPSDEPSDEPVEPSEPDESDDPEDPDEPSAPVSPEPSRPIPTVDQIMSTVANFELEKHSAGALAVNSPFSTIRVGGEYEQLTLDFEGEIINVARSYYGLNSSLFLDVSLEGAVEKNTAGTNGVRTYIELAQIAQGALDKFGDASTAGVSDIEFGTTPDLYLDAGDYASLLNIVYDGNKGLEGGVGIKGSTNGADARLMTGNLSKADYMYMFYMLSDLEALRNESGNLKAVSAVNVDAFVPSSMTPEDFYGDAQNELRKMVNLRNAAYDYIELRVSNFGYNTLDTASEYYVSEQTQADYLVRSYLIFAELGIDRASICQYKDAEGTKYNGFGTLNADGTPKLAQYYLSNMSKVLEGYTFVDKAVNDMGAIIYLFTNDAGDKVYAVWNADTEVDKIENVQLVSDGKSGTLTTLTNSYKLNTTELTVNSYGYLEVDATSTPVFVTVLADENADPEPHIPARELATIQSIMSTYVNFDLEKNNTNVLSIYNPFGAMVVRNTESAISTSVEGVNITIAKSFYAMDPTIYLDVDLSKIKETNDENLADIKTYSQLAKNVKSIQSSFGTGMIGAYRIELGRAPDLSMSATEYAMLLSYCYDGNRGEVASAGIMSSGTASKKAMLFTGNLSAPSSTYMGDVLIALKEIRGHQNVVAISGFNTDSFVSSANTPESYYLTEDNELVKMINLRNTSYNHLEINVSNFGYTTADSESDYYVTEQAQANYLVRSYLIFAGLGVDRATLCQYKDGDGGEYDGFGTLNADGTEKLAQFYLYTMRSTLGGYKFSEVVENDTGALIYKFENADGALVYAVWSPTNDGSTIDNVQITVGDSSATLVTPTDSYTAQESALTVTDGTVSVNAGEAPVFVVVK